MFAAIAVSVLAVVGVIVGARIVSNRPDTSVDDPLALSAVEAPGATTPACAALTAALPAELAGLPRRQIEHGDVLDGTVRPPAIEMELRPRLIAPYGGGNARVRNIRAGIRIRK